MEQEKRADIDYYKLGCNLDDEDANNDCMNCTYGVFPIGCMVGEVQE